MHLCYLSIRTNSEAGHRNSTEIGGKHVPTGRRSAMAKCSDALYNGSISPLAARAAILAASLDRIHWAFMVCLVDDETPAPVHSQGHSQSAPILLASVAIATISPVWPEDTIVTGMVGSSAVI